MSSAFGVRTVGIVPALLLQVDVDLATILSEQHEVSINVQSCCGLKRSSRNTDGASLELWLARQSTTPSRVDICERAESS